MSDNQDKASKVMNYVLYAVLGAVLLFGGASVFMGEDTSSSQEATPSTTSGNNW